MPNKIVVLASEPVGGRSRVTELPCYYSNYRMFIKLYEINATTVYVLEIPVWKLLQYLLDICVARKNILGGNTMVKSVLLLFPISRRAVVQR